MSSPQSQQSERDVLLAVEHAARRVTHLMGTDEDGRWTLGGELVEAEAAGELLSLHDYLNDLTNVREAVAKTGKEQPDA